MLFDTVSNDAYFFLFYLAMKSLIKPILPFTCLLLFITACKKKNLPSPLSSDAFINSFVLHVADNPSIGQDVTGRIVQDSIYLELRTGANISSLVPAISITAKSISPATNVAQNFTNTVVYTVIAEDGNARTYKVVTRILSNTKEITSFILKKQNNPTLTDDITGLISGDSIFLELPTGINPTSLIPSLTFVGTSLYPLSGVANDFSLIPTYTVNAEDGTGRDYRVFGSSNRSAYITSDDGYLYSINTVNGTVRWKFYTGTQAVPTYNNGTVFVSGTGNVIYAINSSNGTLKWKSNPPKGNYFLIIPAAGAGKVYYAGVGYLNYPNSIYAQYLGFLYALNAETGNQEWLDTLFTQFSFTDARLTNPTIKDNTICIYDNMNGLSVFNASDGGALWATPGDMLGRTNPVMANNAIYYGNEGGMKAMSTDGHQLWQLSGALLYSTHTISNNTIYSVANGNTLVAIDLNGVIKWQSSLGTVTFYAPFAASNTLYVLDSDKGLNAYSMDNRTSKWRRTSYSTQPVVCNNEIFICDNSKRLNCLDATSGNVKWTSPAGINFSQPACVVDGSGNAYHITDSGEQQ